MYFIGYTHASAAANWIPYEPLSLVLSISTPRLPQMRSPLPHSLTDGECRRCAYFTLAFAMTYHPPIASIGVGPNEHMQLLRAAQLVQLPRSAGGCDALAVRNLLRQEHGLNLHPPLHSTEGCLSIKAQAFCPFDSNNSTLAVLLTP